MLRTLFPHPLLSQSVFTEFSELTESLFIQKTGKSVWRSPVQNPQKAKIRSVTLQGAEGGLESWIYTVWEECDKWLVRTLLQDIYQKQNISNLTSYLNQDSLKWLNKFVTLIVNQGFERSLKMMKRDSDWVRR